jgi:hypothetical protein
MQKRFQFAPKLHADRASGYSRHKQEGTREVLSLRGSAIYGDAAPNQPDHPGGTLNRIVEQSVDDYFELNKALRAI